MSGRWTFFCISVLCFFAFSNGGKIFVHNDVVVEEDTNSPQIIRVDVKVLPAEDLEAIPGGLTESEEANRANGGGQVPPPVEAGEEGDVEQPPEPVENVNCIMMAPFQAEMYEHYNCQLEELEEGCYSRPVCPEGCIGEDNTTHAYRGDMWPEKNGTELCECVTVHAIIASPPYPPLGGPDWPPFKHCRLNGCEHPYTEEYMPPNAKVALDDRNCTCIEGSDPNLMDYALLYHLNCEVELELTEMQTEGRDTEEEQITLKAYPEEEPTPKGNPEEEPNTSKGISEEEPNTPNVETVDEPAEVIEAFVTEDETED